MGKSVAESLKDLSVEQVETYSGFPVTISSVGSTYLPVAAGIQCEQSPKKSFTIECGGAADIYIQGRIESTGEWCTLKKRDSDNDNKFTVPAGGGSIWFVCEAPITYIRIWFKNTAGANNIISNFKVRLGR